MNALRRIGLAATLAAALVAAGSPAPAAYPDRPVRIIVPFAAGGLNDAVARLVQPHLEKALGQPVIVENRPAASGIVGTDAVAKAPPDGHMLLMVASSHTVVPATNAKLPYDAEKDLTPVALLGKNPLLFVINGKIPAKTLGEFVALAKAEPGKFNYATPGAASQAHLVTALFSERAGIKMQHIPYRGGAPAVLALVAGDAHFMAVSPLAALPQMQAGALRAVAAGSLTRDAQFRDLPTLAESGFPGFEAIQWVGLLTTAGTPREVIVRLNAELNRALQDPELIAKLAVQGVSPAGGTPDAFQAIISSEIKNWTAVAKAANIKAECVHVLKPRDCHPGRAQR
jgi:tripartite-type tricarboxylate transporter receptor subunit TctC